MKDLVLVATPAARERYRAALGEPLGARVVAELSEPAAGREFVARAGELIARHRDAVAVVALPMQAVVALLVQLESSEKRLLIEPLSWGGGGAPAEEAHFAFEWCSLEGARELRATCRAGGVDRARMQVSGTPAAESDDVTLVLAHALALVEFTFGEARLLRAAFGDSDAEVVAELELERGGVLAVRASAGAPRLAMSVDGAGFHFVWRSVGEGSGALREECERRGAPGHLRRAHSAKRAETRGLARLLEPNSAPLVSAAARLRVERLVSAIVAALPHPHPLPASAFRTSRGHDGGPLARWGLLGKVPAGPEPARLDAVLPSVPFEALAFRAGIKPVVFLTVEPEAEAAMLAHFPGTHVERRERRVEVHEQDRWVDRRDSGSPRVELYVSHDAALAREAARLQSETDPSRSLSELGALMGYPSCCVDAFRRQDERSNNTRNRYQTAARTLGSPWHAELSNFGVMVLPFFPCSYRCDAAREQARRVLEVLAATEPHVARELVESVRDPILYFEHSEYVRFGGFTVSEGTIEYSAVRVPRRCSDATSWLAAALGLGNRLHFTDDRLGVYRDGSTVFQLERVERGLGLLASF